MTRRRGARGARRAPVVALLAAVVVSGCTAAPEPGPTPADEVVVAVSVPFGSLNGATPDGRTPGSTLVRGLVQDGFVSLDARGVPVPDPTFGTVELLDEDPLTVRYTIGDDARWSDGVPVTADDLLLEWAARSGALDDVEPRLGADGEITNAAELDAGVAFAATSPALVHVHDQPAVDDEGRVTLTYAHPVADWLAALDVNVPAHVLGESVLGVADRATAADAVTRAITARDAGALSRLAHAWRTAFDADELAGAPASAVTTGPYVVNAVLPDRRVELRRNDAYRGARPARYQRLVVASDLHPLDQVAGLADGTVDVAAPVASPDVLAALAEAGAEHVAAGDAAWQLVADAGHGGVLAPGDDGGADRAAQVREALWLTVPREQIVREVVAPLWAQASADDTVLPTSGEGAGAAGVPPQDLSRARALLTRAQTATPVRVRLAADTADPLRARLVDLVVAAAAQAGIEVVPAAPDAAPGAWDVALVTHGQDDLPAASVAGLWGSDGATNATGWSSDATDDALTALTEDPEPDDAAYDEVARTLLEGGAVLPLVRAPCLTAVPGTPAADRPDVDRVGPLQLSRADVTDWWSWATTSDR